MLDEIIEHLSEYLKLVDSKYPFETASLEGFLDFLKKKKERLSNARSVIKKTT